MISVETARFGPIEVGEDAVFTFPMGVLGFAKHKRFVIVDHSDDSPFKWLQSLDDGGLAFIITDPQFFKPDYHVKVRRGDLRTIDATHEDDLVLSVIVTVPQNPQDMTANLLAPLIFNMANRHGMQLVLTDQRYPVKYNVLRQREADQSAPPEPKSISLR